MDTIHKMVSRRLIDRSHKRHSKRLVADEVIKDVVTDEEHNNVFDSNFNPNFDILSCEVMNESRKWTGTDDGMKRPPENSASRDEYVDKWSGYDMMISTDSIKSGQERTLHRVSSAVRKKISQANPFSGNQKTSESSGDPDPERNSNDSIKSNMKGDPKTVTKEKTTQKKMDMRILGRKLRNEKRQLLIDEVDDD